MIEKNTQQRIETIMRELGLDEQEARFVLAEVDGTTAGDIVGYEYGPMIQELLPEKFPKRKKS